MPPGNACRVMQILNIHEQSVEYAKAGEIVKLKLNLENIEYVKKGDILSEETDSLIQSSEIFLAEV